MASSTPKKWAPWVWASKGSRIEASLEFLSHRPTEPIKMADHPKNLSTWIVAVSDSIESLAARPHPKQHQAQPTTTYHLHETDHDLGLTGDHDQKTGLLTDIYQIPHGAHSQISPSMHIRCTLEDPPYRPTKEIWVRIRSDIAESIWYIPVDYERIVTSKLRDLARFLSE